MTDGYGIFNVRTNLSACRKQVWYKQVCTKVDLEGQKNCCLPCPARGSNPGSLDLNCNSLTTELRSPSHANESIVSRRALKYSRSFIRGSTVYHDTWIIIAITVLEHIVMVMGGLGRCRGLEDVSHDGEAITWKTPTEKKLKSFHSFL